MEYTRNCPECGNEISYNQKGNFNRAVRENRRCRSCSSRQVNSHKKILSFDRNCTECGKPLVYKSYHAWWWAKKQNQKCISCSKKGRILPDWVRKKISKVTKGSKNPMYGRHHTEETKRKISLKNLGNKSKIGQIADEQSKQKMRLAVANRIEKYGKRKQGFNPIACEFLDTLTDYSFIHALNGKEFLHNGYFADGYDAQKNVWIEYDEPRHYNKDGTLKQKDVRRMMEIKKSLGCKFLRYNEKTKELKEW